MHALRTLAIIFCLAASAAGQQDAHCYKGCPSVHPSWRRGDLVAIRRAAYTLQVSTETKDPVWVAEFVTAAEVTGPADRGGYRADPLLRDEPHSTIRDFRDNDLPYDIGHQAAAANHARSQKRMDETFYLSNMAPQVPAFNRGIWRGLETRTRDWVKQRGAVYCVTGPVFWNRREPASPSYKPPTIGENKVAVPTHFFKILVAPARGGRNAESIAFVIPNRAFVAPYDFDDFIKPIAWVEEHTGIDFMPGLSKAERQLLESKAAPNVW